MGFLRPHLWIMASLMTIPDVFAQERPSRVNTQPSPNHLPAPTVTEVKRGANAIKIPKNVSVPPEWIPLLNRAYEEYWMEGNHRPDAGFVLFARNPSKETAKLWLLRMESKAQNLEELFGYVKQAQTELVSSGLMPDRYNMVNQPAPQAVPKSSSWVDPIKASDSRKEAFRDLQFFFLYSPTCPHCARQAQNLVGFPNVHPLQVTSGDLAKWPGLPVSEYATQETIQAYVRDGEQPGAIPVVAIYQPKTNQILKMKGVRSAQEILAAAAMVADQKPTPDSKWPYPGPIHPSKLDERKDRLGTMSFFPKL